VPREHFSGAKETADGWEAREVDRALGVEDVDRGWSRGLLCAATNDWVSLVGVPGKRRVLPAVAVAAFD
jgi:hypothetical protein